MTRNKFNRKAIGSMLAPAIVAVVIGAMSPAIGEAADQTSQQWKKYKQEIHSNFSGFLAESQQSITAAIDELGRMSMTGAKRSEAKALLIQERSALNTLAKSSNTEQLQIAHDVLDKTAQKFAEFKVVTQPFHKADLAATSGMLYSAIKMDELDGYNTPDKRALPWVKYMDHQNKIIQANDRDYKFSKSERFVNAIHNFYTCVPSNTKHTATKSRDNSKESSMANPGNR